MKSCFEPLGEAFLRVASSVFAYAGRAWPVLAII